MGNLAWADLRVFSRSVLYEPINYCWHVHRFVLLF